MKREDLLLALKDAEKKTRALVEEARKTDERNLAKAKQDAAMKLEEGKAKTADFKEKLLAARLMKMEEEARIISERGKQRAEKLKLSSEENLEQAIEMLVKAFESDIDV